MTEKPDPLGAWRPRNKRQAAILSILGTLLVAFGARAINREEMPKGPDLSDCPQGLVGERALREAPLSWYPIPAKCIAPDVLRHAGVMWLQ